ncbi:MAG: terpene synthase family protein [Mycobacteriales bacterium]
MPFPARLHPGADLAERHARNALAGWGLLGTPGARRRYDALRPGHLTGRIYPDTRMPDLVLLTELVGVLFLLDDELDEGRLDLDGLAALGAGLLGILTARYRPRPGDDPYLVSLSHLWGRIAAARPPAWRRRFTRHVAEYVDACRREAVLRAAGTRLDLPAYVELRRAAGFARPSTDLIELAARIDVPDRAHAAPPLRALVDAAADLVLWANDVVSFDRERAAGEVNNLVLILDGDLAGLERMLSLRLWGFLRLEESISPLWTELGLTRAERTACQRYVIGLRHWVRGNLDWCGETTRYAS